MPQDRAGRRPRGGQGPGAGPNARGGSWASRGARPRPDPTSLTPPNPRQSAAEGPPPRHEAPFPGFSRPPALPELRIPRGCQEDQTTPAGCIVLPRPDKFGELNRRGAVSRLAEKRSRDGNGTGTIFWKNVGRLLPAALAAGPPVAGCRGKTRAARRRLDRPEEERRPGPWSLACPAGGSSASSATRPSRVPHARAGWPARGGGLSISGESEGGTAAGAGRRGRGHAQRGRGWGRGRRGAGRSRGPGDRVDQFSHTWS